MCPDDMQISFTRIHPKSRCGTGVAASGLFRPALSLCVQLCGRAVAAARVACRRRTCVPMPACLPALLRCAQVLPLLFPLMSDPDQSVCERACYALDAFCEALER